MTYWVTLGKRGGTDSVFPWLAGLLWGISQGWQAGPLQGISRRQSPREILRSSPASPRRTPSLQTFFLSDLHSFSKRILQLSKIETVYKEENIFCKAYWGHIRCKIANSATTFFPNFSVRFLMCFLLLLCWRSPVHSRKTALTDCNMSWRLPSVVSQHLALADFMYDFLNIHIF